MVLISFLITAFITACHGSKSMRYHPDEQSPKPTWADQFYITGTLYLPYAEIAEPFAAWYDGINKKSRVDTYGGMDKTIQRQDWGKYGAHILVAPMSNEVVTNQQNCFRVNGTESAPVTIQSLLPDLSKFRNVGQKTYKGMEVIAWEYVLKHGNKVNNYTMLVHHTSLAPILYRMNGYNSLTGSHYDEYRVEYGMMVFNVSSDVFDKPMHGLRCHGFPGPGYEARIVANPMKEYIHPVDDSHVHHMHNDFRTKYKKNVKHESRKEYEGRKETFRHNLRYIHSINRQHLSFKLKVNHLAEHTPGELRRLRGRRTTPRSERSTFGLKEFTMLENVDIPEEINWRLYGAVTPVKDQATCGSCWSFGSTGTIEGTYFLKTGQLVELSQQNLMDCSWGFGNNACDGGEDFRSFQYILKHGGLATEVNYGPYLGADGFCQPNVSKSIQITGYKNVKPGSISALKQSIALYGPVSVGIDAAHLSLVFHSHGVYYEPKCGNKTEDLDHAVLAVGYGTLDSEPYWLVKNSWSTHWGNDGYVLMSQKDNNCGVATDASFVLMEN